MAVSSQRKGIRRLVALLAVLAVAAALWFWVFPWIDRTYVNRPQIQRGIATGTRLTPA